MGSKTGSLGSKSSRVGQEGSTGCKEGGVGSVTGSEVNNYKQTVVVSGKRADALENGMRCDF